tara:strand:- start:265 stop:408 length:144 start_codon:yes stop_codon:yes gene_type:complete
MLVVVDLQMEQVVVDLGKEVVAVVLVLRVHKVQQVLIHPNLDLVVLD